MPKRRNTTWKKQIIEKQVQCRECGSLTPSKSTYAICCECKARMHKYRARHFLKELHYEIIYDPLGFWGYSPGASFSVTELACMTRANNLSLTNGTILKRGIKFYIVNPPERPGKPQRLAQIDAPALNIKLQPA